MKNRKFFLIAVPIIFLLGLQGALAQNATTTFEPTEEEMQYAEAYWTPERMRAAKPIPWYDEEADLGADRQIVEEEQLGPAGSAPSGLPEENDSFFSPVEPESEEFEDARQLIEEPDNEDFGSQNVYDDTYITTSSNNRLQTQFPYRAVGKLFITTSTGGSGSCTASVISWRDKLVTAAHCCYDRSKRRWNRSWRFGPAHRNGVNPYGLWTISRARVLTGWITSGGRHRDVCVMSVRGDISARTGHLGRAWNWGSTQHYHAYGYPGNIGSGRYPIECTAESYRNCGSSLVNAMGCSQTYGASGGPWIVRHENFRTGAMNYVNSVVSGIDSCTGTFGKSYNGARFTSNNIVPLCNAEGC